MKSSEQEREDVLLSKQFGYYTFFVIIIFILFSAILWFTNFKGEDGDKFGLLNALFSGLAFAGLLATLNLQKKELALQRKELEMTRDELANHTKAFTRQRFETTFFNLLNTNRSLFSAVEISDNSGANISGFKAISFIYSEFKGICYNRIQDFCRINKLKYEGNPHQLFDQFEASQRHSFYFNIFKEAIITRPNNVEVCVINLCEILKIVYHDESLTESEKKQFATILKSQLSSETLCLLFYYAISGLRPREVDFYLNHFEYFKNLSQKHLVNELDEIALTNVHQKVEPHSSTINLPYS